MSEVIVVGAGLAGLVAAINCARAGHEVRVLEEQEKVGGLPGLHPSVDSTPMRPERLGEFLGIELKPPYVTPTPVMRSYVFGKVYEADANDMYLHAVERGSRSTSLDSCLYEAARKEGVNFEFGWKLRSQQDLAQLPPGSIIATGLTADAFMALNIPYQDVYGYTANARYEGPPFAAAWFTNNTRDYCYFANANGIAFALFFDHKPVKRSFLEEWSLQIQEHEGVEFSNWRDFGGVIGTKRFDNARLFAGGKIMAGTLAGMNDPMFLFGVHASLVSGKIAAMAVDDKAEAYGLFRKITSVYKYTWTMRRFSELQPLWMRRAALSTFLPLQSKFPGTYRKIMLSVIPGFNMI